MSTNNNDESKAKRTRLSPEARRQQLLDVAITVTAKNGLGRATHAEIARLAGVAISTVFFYFPTVDNLNNSVIDEIVKVISSISLHQPINKVNKIYFSNILNVYEQNLEQFIKSNYQLATIFLEWSNAINSPLWPRFLAFRATYLEFTKKILSESKLIGELRDDIDIDVSAYTVSSMLLMLFKMKFYNDSDVAIREIFLYLRNHLLK